MKQFEGFIIDGEKDMAYKLKKSLYGLKKSPKTWYQKFDKYIKQLGFVRSQEDHYVYLKKVDDDFIYVALYADEFLLVSNKMDLVKEEKL